MSRRILRATLRAVFAVLLLVSAFIGFGVTGGDQTRLATFVDSVEQWQTNTEFRQVAMQYVTRGSDAMRSRPMGFTSADWIMWIRSLPMMPPEFAVNDTSRLHYQQFSKGPLSAYLHLCTEVQLCAPDGTGGYISEFEGKFGQSAMPSNDEIRAWLAGLKWDYPVVADAGAVQSVQSAIMDVEPHKPLTIRVPHIDQQLIPHIESLATELKLPTTDVEAMTPLQQYAVFDRLDPYVRRHDPELWRTKQVSDMIGGIWGQVFSPPYLELLSPYLKLVDVCRWLTLALLGILIVWQIRAVRAARRERAGAVDDEQAQPRTERAFAEPQPADAG